MEKTQMQIEMTKWELEKLMEAERALKLEGRALEYATSRRLEALQKRLDKLIGCFEEVLTD